MLLQHGYNVLFKGYHTKFQKSNTNLFNSINKNQRELYILSQLIFKKSLKVKVIPKKVPVKEQ